jgi:hypothetical protein
VRLETATYAENGLEDWCKAHARRAETSMALPKPCYTCQHRRGKTESKARGHVLVLDCSKRGIRFGYQWQYDAGENMPDKCTDRLPMSFSLTV